MKAHIREEKKTASFKLGKGTLLQEKDGKFTRFATRQNMTRHIQTMKLSRSLYLKKIRFKKKISKIFLIGRLCLRRIIFEE